MAAKKKTVRRSKKPVYPKEIYVVTDATQELTSIDEMSCDDRITSDRHDADKLAQRAFENYVSDIDWETSNLENNGSWLSGAAKAEHIADAKENIAMATRGRDTLSIVIYKPVKVIAFKQKAKKKSPRRKK